MKDQETTAASSYYPYGWWKEENERNGNSKDQEAPKKENMELGPRLCCRLLLSPQIVYVET